MKKSGDRVGRYLIEAPIGSGGMGEVYEAHDTRLGRRVALKLLRSGARDVAIPRLLREAQAAAAFEHPNAVVVFDAGEELGEAFIAMELVRGKPLRAFLGDQSIPISRRLQWMIDAARAIGAAHRVGLIHRDVKPDNIVLRNDGVIKVLDFGIARRQRASSDRPVEGDASGVVTADDVGRLATLTSENALIGTPAYLSPEQLCREEIDARTDQFAWAVTTYEVLAGEPPWTSGDPVTLLSRILTSDPPPLCERFPEIPAPVEEALRRALSKHPQDRFSTIEEAAEALEAFAAPASVGQRTSHGSAPPLTRAAEVQAHTNPRPRVTTGADPTTESTACNVTGAPGQSTPVPQRAGRLPGQRWFAAGAALAISAGIAVLGARPALRGGAGRAASAQPEVPPALAVRALACKEARVTGDDTSPELARAIGVGACARLAIDIGAAWDPRGRGRGDDPAPALTGGTIPGQNGLHELDVEARIEDGGAVVTLAVGDRKSTAGGRTPMDAIVGATAALAPQLAPPAMTPAEVAAWGARDAAGARRIARVMYRMLLDLAPDDQAAARALLATDGDSPWAQYIAWTADLGGAEQAARWKKGMQDGIDRLPRAPALLLQGMLMSQELVYSGRLSSDASKEALRLLRQAYAEAPNDPEIAAGFATSALSWAEEESLAVLDKLYERSPAHCIYPTRNLLKSAASRDIESEHRNIARLHAAFPESVAWDLSVYHAVRSGHLDEARKAVALGVRLGMTGMSSGGFYAEHGRIWLSLATLDPKGAREIATKMLSVPRDFVVQTGANALIASYLQEGRLDDALSMERREVERQLANKKTNLAVHYASLDLSQRLVLGLPLPDAERLDWLDATAVTLHEPATGPAVRLLTGIARMTLDPAKHRRAAEQALKDLETLAERESGKSRVERDGLLVRTMAGVRKLRGDAEAGKRWKETGRAPDPWRRAFALEAGLALAATGDRAGAEQAYKLAMDPESVEHDALRGILGRVKLAELYRAEKRDQEAAALEAEVDRVWAGADPGLRDRIEALR